MACWTDWCDTNPFSDGHIQTSNRNPLAESIEFEWFTLEDCLGWGSQSRSSGSTDPDDRADSLPRILEPFKFDGSGREDFFRSLNMACWTDWCDTNPFSDGHIQTSNRNPLAESIEFEWFNLWRIALGEGVSLGHLDQSIQMTELTPSLEF